MSTKKLIKALGLIIVVALLAAALPLQAKAATTTVTCTGTGNSFAGITSPYALFEGFGDFSIVGIFNANTWPAGYIASGNRVVPASVVYPSTNDINRTNGWAHVDFVSADADAQTMTFNFVQTRNFFSCVEYRTSSETSPYYQKPNYNLEILDGLWRYTCSNTTGQTPITIELGPDDTHVEFRLSFGAEKDERFYWTPFAFVPEAWVDDDYTAATPGWGVTHFATIQDGIDAVAEGGTVNVAAGTYNEQVNINKQVSIVGAGKDGPNPTIITSTANRTVLLGASGTEASPILLKDLQIQGSSGIYTTFTPIDYVTLESVWLNANPVKIGEGFRLATGHQMTHLTITNSIIEGYLDGIIIEKTPVTGDDGTKLQFVTMTNTIFKNNYRKGMYVETLSDAIFTDVQLLNNGYVTPGSNLAEYHSAGFDINLKDGNYSNLQFINMTAIGNGLTSKEGAALMIKARDDGATYGAYPATLSNVHITGGTFTGNERGIRFGEPGTTNAGPTNVVITDAAIHSNFKTYGGTDGSAYGDVINWSQATINAENNWWGSITGPAAGSIVGNVDYLPFFVFSDLVLDNSDIDENLPKDTVIGKFSPVDADPSDVFTYELVDDDENPNNNPFKIVGDQLLSNEIFDFEDDEHDPEYNILVRATDPWETVFEKSFTITINDVNEKPVLKLEGFPVGYKGEIKEGDPFYFTAKGTDVDAGQSLSYKLVDKPDGMELAPVGDQPTEGKKYTWTPSEEQGPGVYTFTVKVCDDATEEQGGPLCAEQPVTVTVNEVNEAPEAKVDTYGVIKNTTRVVDAPGVLANDTDADDPANDLKAILVTAPTDGVLDLKPDGSFTYIPPEGKDSGFLSFTYKVFDGTVESASAATVTLNFRASNSAPEDLTFSDNTTEAEIDENNQIGALIGTFTTTDPDSGDTSWTYSLVPGEGDAASFKICGDAKNQLCAAEAFNYEGQKDYSVSVRTTDQFGATFEQIFTITVKDINDAPVLDQIENQVVDENELLTFTASASDEDRPAQTLVFSLEDGEEGDVPEGAEISPYGVFSWRPTKTQGGEDYTFDVCVEDNGIPAEKECQTITVTVIDFNAKPVANNQSVTITEDYGDKSITLSGSDADDEDTITFTIVDKPSNGKLTGEPPAMTYKPNDNFNGTDSFTFKVNDGKVDSDIATVTIIVTPVNDPPTVKEGQVYRTLKDQSLTVPAPGVLTGAKDVDGDEYIAVLYQNATSGRVDLNEDGSFTYTPVAGWAGDATFKFRAYDGTEFSEQATVTIHVVAVNNAPTGITIYPTNTPENEIYEGTLEAQDDPGDIHTFELVPGVGAVDNDDFEIDGDQLISKVKFNFEEQITYQVRVKATDYFGKSIEKPLVITVTDINDAPVADDQEVSTLMNTPIEITLTGSDEDGDELIYAIFSEPEDGKLKATEVPSINFAGNGVLRVVENKLTYTPDDGFAGEDSFTFKVMDESGAISNLATVTIDVGDIPVAVDDAYEATEDEELSVDAEKGVLANDTAVDPTKLVAELVDDVEHGTLELAPDGSFTYLPEENFVGKDVFTYNACVEGGECSEEPATVTITVEPVNDEPNAVDDEYETPMGKKLEVPAPGVLENDIDPDQGDEQTVEVKDAPLHGVLVLNPDGSFTYEPAAGFHGIDTFTYWLTSEPGVQSAYLDWATVRITVRPVARIFLPIILK